MALIFYTPPLPASIIRLPGVPGDLNLLEIGKERVGCIAISNPRTIPLTGPASIHGEDWVRQKDPWTTNERPGPFV